jgi:uncharacterized protein (TIGR02118 family)
MKLIALYTQPADPAAFDEKYFNTHLPLIRQVPGLQKTVITRFTRSLSGQSFYLMAEMYFADKETLKAAMKSPEMAAAGENLNSFAAGAVSMLYGEEEPASGSTAGTAVSTAAA